VTTHGKLFNRGCAPEGAVKITSTHLSIDLLHIIFRRTFPLVNNYGAPAGARVSIIFIPGAFAPRLIYDAAAAAKKR
jgi:hypothetical protein